MTASHATMTCEEFLDAAAAVSLFPAAYGAYAGEHDHRRERLQGMTLGR